MSHIEGFEAPIHASLGQAILLGGAPRGIAIVNGTIAAAVGLGLQQWLVGIAIWAVGHAIAVFAARRDPDFVPVLLRHLRQKGYGRLLDAAEQHLALADVQCFETESLMGQAGVVAPVLTYLFHRLEERFDGRPTLLVLDEAWIFLDHPLFAARIREWLKTLRKKNVAVLFATQSLVATAWVALRPTALHLAGQADDQAVAAKAPPDTLSGLPGSYGDVPKLGPPLPGDLGRPILDHQRAIGIAPVGGETGRAEQAAATERDRRAAELKAARESGLLVQSGNRTDTTRAADATPSSPPVAATDASRLAIDPDRDPNAQQRKADFVAARDTGGDVNEHRLSPPASPDMLSAGSVIAASLITGLRSDLPGLVTAQVTERVFDSATGSILLIPQGARLIGSYDSVVAFGQKRALVVWQRIILPDGSSIRLDNVPATDPSGYAGLADKVDFHTWTLLKGVAISTLLGVGANVTFSGESDLVQAIRESTQQNVSRAGDQITSRNLQIQPTITIRPGAPVRLVVHRDLVLAPWKE